jgi:hypothetical protein
MSGAYNEGTIVTLTATPNAGYRVLAWHGTNNDSSTALTNTVTLNTNRIVTVEFTQTMYALTATVSGGSGTVAPETGTYLAGTVVILTATPDSGNRVKTWTGTDDDTATASSNTVTMNSNRTVSVEFEQSPEETTPEETTTKNDNDDDKKILGICFISAADRESPHYGGMILFIMIAGVVFSGIRHLGKRIRDN